VREYADRWLTEHMAITCKPRTLEHYKSVFTHHVYPGLGGVALAGVSRKRLRSLLADRAANGRESKSQSKAKHAKPRAVGNVAGTTNHIPALGPGREGSGGPLAKGRRHLRGCCQSNHTAALLPSLGGSDPPLKRGPWNPALLIPSATVVNCPQTRPGSRSPPRPGIERHAGADGRSGAGAADLREVQEARAHGGDISTTVPVYAGDRSVHTATAGCRIRSLSYS
jgi:hypothetical protein